MPAGASQPRLLSSNADAFHSKHASTGPKIIGAHFANQGDDGIAINTDFHLVAYSRRTTLAVGAKTSYDLLRFQPGDRVRGYNRSSGRVAEATVLAITRDPSLDRRLTGIRNTHLPDTVHRLNTGYRLTLERP